MARIARCESCGRETPLSYTHHGNSWIGVEYTQARQHPGDEPDAVPFMMGHELDFCCWPCLEQYASTRVLVDSASDSNAGEGDPA